MSLDDIYRELQDLKETVRIDNVSKEIEAAHEMLVEKQGEVRRIDNDIKSLHEKLDQLQSMNLEDLLKTHASLEGTLKSLRSALPKYLEDKAARLTKWGALVFVICIVSNWGLVLWWSSDMRAHERLQTQLQVEATLKKDNWALRKSSMLNSLEWTTFREHMFVSKLNSCVSQREEQNKDRDKVNCLKQAAAYAKAEDKKYRDSQKKK